MVPKYNYNYLSCGSLSILRMLQRCYAWISILGQRCPILIVLVVFIHKTGHYIHSCLHSFICTLFTVTSLHPLHSRPRKKGGGVLRGGGRQHFARAVETELKSEEITSSRVWRVGVGGGSRYSDKNSQIRVNNLGFVMFTSVTQLIFNGMSIFWYQWIRNCLNML